MRSTDLLSVAASDTFATMTTDAAVRPRKPKQARSVETQRKLLQATIECLAELGYPRLTLARVSERSGVSKGALFMHYPTKACLVVAAIEAFHESLGAEYPSVLARVQNTAKQKRAHAAIRVLWDMVRRPEYRGAQEVYALARTDPELAALLQPVARQAWPLVRAAAVTLVSDEPVDKPAFDAFVSMALLSLEAAAADVVAIGDDEIHEPVLRYLEDQISRFINDGEDK